MEGQLPDKIKNQRYRSAMKLQQRIAAELAESQCGKILRVLVEQPRIARSEHDAPDVDCRVILSRKARVGEFINVRATGAQVYDLLAEPVG